MEAKAEGNRIITSTAVKSDRWFVALNLPVVQTVASFQLVCLFLRISFVIMQTDTNNILQWQGFECVIPFIHSTFKSR